MQDPQTGQNFEYIVHDDLRFELCADFKTTADDLEYSYEYAMPVLDSGSMFIEYENWPHDRGRVCFTRTINLEYFKQEDGRMKDELRIMNNEL